MDKHEIRARHLLATIKGPDDVLALIEYLKETWPAGDGRCILSDGPSPRDGGVCYKNDIPRTTFVDWRHEVFCTLYTSPHCDDIRDLEQTDITQALTNLVVHASSMVTWLEDLAAKDPKPLFTITAYAWKRYQSQVYANTEEEARAFAHRIADGVYDEDIPCQDHGTEVQVIRVDV